MLIAVNLLMPGKAFFHCVLDRLMRFFLKNCMKFITLRELLHKSIKLGAFVRDKLQNCTIVKSTLEEALEILRVHYSFALESTEKLFHNNQRCRRIRIIASRCCGVHL